MVPVLNGNRCLLSVFALHKGADTKQVIPSLEDRVLSPPHASAMNITIQVEALVKLPHGGMASNASTTVGKPWASMPKTMQPQPTLVSRGFEGLVPGPIEVQEPPPPL
jgi:hypothetical protein